MSDRIVLRLKRCPEHIPPEPFKCDVCFENWVEAALAYPAKVAIAKPSAKETKR
jgi:hypothetical protein